MCYFLRGAINDGINDSDYAEILRKSEYSQYHFKNGTEKDVNSSVEKGDFIYRITGGMCDCSTPLGAHHENKNGIREFADMLTSMQSIRNIKHVYLSLNWVGSKNTKKETVHIQDIDIPYFLANIEENCLYKIMLYKKYY